VLVVSHPTNSEDINTNTNTNDESQYSDDENEEGRSGTHFTAPAEDL
jgi:hypothetical protein